MASESAGQGRAQDAAELRRAVAEHESEPQKMLSGLEKEMPDDLGEMVAVAWKPDCRGLTSEWVERKWRQRV